MKKWTIRAAWTVSICLVAHLSLGSPREMPISFADADKIAHVLAYAWLAILPFFGFEEAPAAYAGALLMIPYGIALEFAQQGIPGRDFSVSDMVADACGVILGIAAGKYLGKRFWPGKVRLRSGRTAP